MVRPESSAGVSVTVPSGLTVPADKVEPVGISLKVIDSVSSGSTRLDEISSVIGVSSSPVTFWALMVGVSATGLTLTLNVSEMLALSGPSTEVATTDRSKSPLKCSGGVMVRPLNCAGVRVTEPSALTVPFDRVAPSGMSETVMDKTSLGSVRPDAISSAIAVSSFPVMSLTARVGVSATGAISTSRVLTVDAVSGPSAEVEVTVRLIWPLKLAGGSSCKPESSAGLSVTVPSGFRVPADNVAPAGMSLMVTERVSDMSVNAVVISRSTSVSSMPVAGVTVKSGASATGRTLTVKLSAIDATSAPSVDVALIDRSKEPEKLFGA